MLYHRTTLSKFIIEDQRRATDPHPDLTSLLNDVQTACKLIALSVSRGALDSAGLAAPREQRKALYENANDVMIGSCEAGGTLAAILCKSLEAPYRIPATYPRGRYLLSFEPIDGLSNIDVNATVGTIFSVLRCASGVEEPTAEDFLQPGTAQVAAGYAIYGPVSMLVLTLGAGVHGFTLDPSIGAFTLSHPAMTIAPATREFAVNISNERYWEPPVRRYIEECIEGKSGPRAEDFNMRWVASMVAEVHRILVRGGLFMYPRDNKEPSRAGRFHLLYEANPMAFIVEQAGGAASTGRTRLMEVMPTGIHQRVPVILGSREEVERLVAYHADESYQRPPAFDTPLFQVRSLFRSA
jgi:fructose-1,6-bisphosphatase